MSLLNKKYYQDLWDKYKNINTFYPGDCNKFTILNLKMIIESYNTKKPIQINFQSTETLLHQIGQHLFVELANDIYCNYPDYPPFNDGDKVRSKNRIRNGKTHAVYIDFVIIKKPKNRYDLYNEKQGLKYIGKTYENLVEQYIPLKPKTHNETLSKFFAFFEELNGKQVHDFTPTYFDRKSVFIAPKTFYDSLEEKDKIPSTYFPNQREENNPHETKSIPALPDSIIYFVPKYNVCYDKILLQGKKVDTIVVYDTEETEIEQIIQDKNHFGFNLIVLTNSTEPIKCSQIPCWNWYQEETDIVNTL